MDLSSAFCVLLCQTETKQVKHNAAGYHVETDFKKLLIMREPQCLVFPG